MTALPSALTKTHWDSGGDDPKQARSELSDDIDKINTLRSYLSGLFGDDGTAGTARSNLSVFSKSEVQNQSGCFGTITGTTGTYAVTLSPALTAYAQGQRISVKTNEIMASSATLNANTLGAKKVYKPSSTVQIDGTETIANQIVEFVYNTSLDSGSGGWQMVSPPIASAGAGFKSLQVFTTTGANTWTRPSGVTRIVVQVWGAGGGGGGGNGGGVGGTGGTSSFGAHASCTGGPGGNGGGTGTYMPSHMGLFATGGTGTGGDLNLTGGLQVPGGGGATALNATAGAAAGGMGGFPSASGSGAGGYGAIGGSGGYSLKTIDVTAISSVSVTIGTGGTGGTAGTSASPGRAGGPGLVIVWEY